MNSQQFDTIVSLLNRIAVALETNNRAALPQPGEVPASPYATEVPEGFDTVLGYFSKTRPSAFSLMDDPVDETQADLMWCIQEAHVRAIPVSQVVAPPAMRGRGVETTPAFPVSLLHERIAA